MFALEIGNRLGLSRSAGFGGMAAAFFVFLGCAEKSNRLRPGQELEVNLNTRFVVEIAEPGEYWVELQPILVPFMENRSETALRPGNLPHEPNYWFGKMAPGEHDFAVRTPYDGRSGKPVSTEKTARAKLIALPACSPVGTLALDQPLTVTVPPAGKGDPRGGCAELALAFENSGTYRLRSHFEEEVGPQFSEVSFGGYAVDANGVTVNRQLSFEPSLCSFALQNGKNRIRLMNATDKPVPITLTISLRQSLF